MHASELIERVAAADVAWRSFAEGEAARVYLAEMGRRVRINELGIAAIAASKHLPVVAQDEDFEVLEGVADLAVICIEMVVLSDISR